MNNIPFSTDEFLITKPRTVNLEISDKIWKYHIIPMIPVRKEIGLAVWPSLRSGYRPEWYELSKGRDGKSQHCFRGKGAVDWTCADFANNKDEFLKLIIKHTEYTRIAIYGSFIHCDYKDTKHSKRELYKSTRNSKWSFYKYASDI